MFLFPYALMLCLSCVMSRAMEYPSNNDGEERINLNDNQLHYERQEFERRVARGRTIMSKLIKLKNSAVKLSLEWNVKNHVISDNASSFTSFIGTTVREKVPITVENWRRAKDHKTIVLDEITVNLMWFVYYLIIFFVSDAF